MPDKVTLGDKFATFDERWAPRVIATVDDYEVKIAKLEGTFVWHSHADEDELFYVVEGRLEIDFRDRTESLGPGELIVVPRGVEHRPRAEGETRVLLFERRGVVNTGDVENELTVLKPERI